MSIENSDFSVLKDDDKRYFPRWEVAESVRYHLEGEDRFHVAQTRDISCAGACIAGDVHVAPNQMVKITIEIADGVKVKLNARILWVKDKDGEPQMGVTFQDTPDDIQDLILQHAFELDRDKFLKQLFKGWENP